jgi:hypothetical protein
VPGRKNLLWVSAAFPLVIGEIARQRPIIAPGARNAIRSPYQDRRSYGEEMQQTMTALNNANVAVYPIDARGLSCNPDAIININTMKNIAAATGGKAFYDRSDLSQGVRAALDDSHQVYLLTYTPQPLSADGTYHTIRVSNSKPGVQLRYRHGYYAPGKEEAGNAAPDRLATVLSSPLDASGIGIQATVGQPGGDEVSISLHIDLADIGLTPTAGKWQGALQLEAMQTGPAGERLGGVSQLAEINLGQATYQRGLVDGLPFEMKFKRHPAAVAVRIGVSGRPTGRAGSLSVRLAPLEVR